MVRMILGFIAALALGVLAPAIAHAEGGERYWVYGSAGGGTRLIKGAGDGAGNYIGLRYQLRDDQSHAWFDLRFGESYYHQPTEMMVGDIVFGGRWEAPVAGWRPSVFAGFAHAHESSLAIAKAKPLAVATGVQRNLTHRTGLAADVALSTPEFRGQPWFCMRLFARASVSWYADQSPTPLYVRGDVGAGFAF